VLPPWDGTSGLRRPPPRPRDRPRKDRLATSVNRVPWSCARIMRAQPPTANDRKEFPRQDEAAGIGCLSALEESTKRFRITEGRKFVALVIDATEQSEFAQATQFLCHGVRGYSHSVNLGPRHNFVLDGSHGSWSQGLDDTSPERQVHSKSIPGCKCGSSAYEIPGPSHWNRAGCSQNPLGPIVPTPQEAAGNEVATGVESSVPGGGFTTRVPLA
jgi:hypothetical protein